jgi:hypothetical protein
MNTARLMIQIDLGSSPISGSLLDMAGVAHPFSGWMQLASVLHEVISAANEFVLQ